MLYDTNSHLAQPHVHQSVPRLADLPHVQLTCARCHQSRCHSTWVRSVQSAWIGCVKTSKLLVVKGQNAGLHFHADEPSLSEIFPLSSDMCGRTERLSCNTVKDLQKHLLCHRPLPHCPAAGLSDQTTRHPLAFFPDAYGLSRIH